MTCTCVRAELGAIGTSKEAQLSAVASDKKRCGVCEGEPLVVQEGSKVFSLLLVRELSKP